MNKLSWPELIAIEPKLKTLQDQLSLIKDSDTQAYFCANDVWYGYKGKSNSKAILVDLVGFDAVNRDKDPYLYTAEAYNTAYSELYNSLPNCRGCSCAGMGY